jgi:hypothetical protein
MELLKRAAPRVVKLLRGDGFHLDSYRFATGTEMKIAGLALWLESA